MRYTASPGSGMPLRQLVGMSMSEIFRTAALDYLVEVLHAKEFNPKTINRHLYAVSGALRWALKRELIAGVPAIPKQAEGVGQVNYLTEQDRETSHPMAHRS